MGWMAYDHGVLLVPHGWNTAMGVAADLAFGGHARGPLGRIPDRRSLHRRDHSAAFQLDADGLLPIPTRPGLGIELNPDAIAKY